MEIVLVLCASIFIVGTFDLTINFFVNNPVFPISIRWCVVCGWAIG